MVYTDNNSVSINGRVAKDAVLKTIKDDFCEVKFTICSNTITKKNNEWVAKPNFFIVKYKGKNLGKFADSLKKGKQVSVEGILQQDTWGEGENQNSMTYILAEKIQSFNTQSNSSKPADSTPTEVYNDGDYPEDIPF